MIIRVPAPALSHLRPALRLAGPARPVIGRQGRRAARPAARGRRAAPDQSPAPAGLGRPRRPRHPDPARSPMVLASVASTRRRGAPGPAAPAAAPAGLPRRGRARQVRFPWPPPGRRHRYRRRHPRRRRPGPPARGGIRPSALRTLNVNTPVAAAFWCRLLPAASSPAIRAPSRRSASRPAAAPCGPGPARPSRPRPALVPAPDRRRVHPERRCDLCLARGAQPHQLNGSSASMQAACWSRSVSCRSRCH
jgi:hypothetical protein